MNSNNFIYLKLKAGRSGARCGFTLVEMLIVVAIIGILAAIAIPQFAIYRQTSYCAMIKSDLVNLAISQEAYYYDNDSYLVATQGAGGSSNVPNFSWSIGVTLASATGNVTGWTAVANHPNCGTGPYTYDSTAGGMQ